MLGMIAVIFIERAIHKILISVFLSREFKHDETNRAWWTGKWYGRGLGAHAMSQPAREFIVKVIELSLWSSDILLRHFLLLMSVIFLLVPFLGSDICYWTFLVTPFETDSCTVVFVETETTEERDCYQVWNYIPIYSCTICSLDSHS